MFFVQIVKFYELQLISSLSSIIVSDLYSGEYILFWVKDLWLLSVFYILNQGIQSTRDIEANLYVNHEARLDIPDQLQTCVIISYCGIIRNIHKVNLKTFLTHLKIRYGENSLIAAPC